MSIIKSYAAGQSAIKYITEALVGLAFVLGLATGFLYHSHTFVQTRTVHVGVPLAQTSAAQVAQAWGRPDAQYQGTQVNPGLVGYTCASWKSKSAVVCWK